MNAEQLLDNYNELQKAQLRNNFKTFTLKELKKEMIKMKANKFAVTKMKRNHLIELIVRYHYLFPHLLTNQGTKRTTKGKRPTTQPINIPSANYQNIPLLNHNPEQNIPLITQQHLNSLNRIDPKALEGLPIIY